MGEMEEVVEEEEEEVVVVVVDAGAVAVAVVDDDARGAMVEVVEMIIGKSGAEVGAVTQRRSVLDAGMTKTGDSEYAGRGADVRGEKSGVGIAWPGCSLGGGCWLDAEST